MRIGDIILPHFSRFPDVDPKGVSVEVHDDFIGQPAVVTKVDRCFVEVAFVKTGKTWVYRIDEVTLHCTKEEWGTLVAEMITDD